MLYQKLLLFIETRDKKILDLQFNWPHVKTVEFKENKTSVCSVSPNESNQNKTNKSVDIKMRQAKSTKKETTTSDSGMMISSL